MPVVLHVAADDSAVKDVKGGEQGGRAVAFIVVRHRAGATRLHRQPWLGAVEGLDLALLVDRENDGVGRRVTTSLSFSANFGSFDSLNVRMRCGASWWASRMRCTDRKLTPAAFASIRPVQWVASPGGGPVTRSMTSCTSRPAAAAYRACASCRAATPSTPSAMN